MCTIYFVQIDVDAFKAALQYFAQLPESCESSQERTRYVAQRMGEYSCEPDQENERDGKSCDV